MNKIKFTLLLVLALVCCFAFSACDNSTEAPTETPTEPQCRHPNIMSTSIEPTCDREGYALHECTACDYSYKTNVVAPIGHTYKETVTSPTCETQGYTTYTCECGFTYKSDIIPPLGHTYTDTVTPPTCTAEGYTTYTCSCGDTYVSNHVIPLAHTYIQTTVAPTCTENGYTENICECGDTYLSDFVSFTGHTYTPTVTAPTCEEGGYTTYTCECGDSYVSDRVAPLGHIFKANITPPTCTEAGYTDYVCACESTYRSDIVEPLGHTFEKKVTFPTISKMGYTDYSCFCGYAYTGDYLFYQDTVTTVIEGDSSVILSRGIDVSIWQHQNVDGVYLPLDWNAIKAEGVEFAILRASYSTRKCGVFEMNYADAKAAGMPVGAYCYTTATTVEGIKEEAYALLEFLSGKQFEYPIYFDLEDPAQKELGQETLMQMCITFYEILQSHGYYVALYTNNNWLQNILNTEFVYNNFDIWYARYKNYDEVIWGEAEDREWNISYAPSTGMWQYTSSGVLSSIPGVHVDLNYCYKDYPTIIKELGLNGYGEQSEATPEITFIWTTASSLNIRSTPDFTADNIIGSLSKGSKVEALEITDSYVKIFYNGQEAYISPTYISYTEIIVA